MRLPLLTTPPMVKVSYIRSDDIAQRKLDFVTLKIYNVLGQEVATLYSGLQKAGNYAATFNAGRFASGVYFYRLSAGSFSSVKKMMLLK